MNTQRRYLLVVVPVVVAVIASVLLMSSPTQSAADLPVTTFSNQMPSAFGKWDVVKADTMAVLLDLTKDQVMGDMPEVALTGQTVKITCKTSRFSVTTTDREKPVVHEVHKAGTVIELTDNGPYTIVLFSADAEPKPVAVSYFVKMSEAELEELKELGQPMEKPASPDRSSI